MIAKLIQKRKSIRIYNDQDIPLEIIYSAIDSAKYAPSGKNRQPWRVKVLTNKEKSKLLNILKDVSEVNCGSLPISTKAIETSSHTLLIFNPYSLLEKDYTKKRLLVILY